MNYCLTYVTVNRMTTDDPDDQQETIKTLLNDCLERDVPLTRCHVTRPPALCMDKETILQSQRDKLRQEAHQSNSESSWSAFREVRKKERCT